MLQCWKLFYYNVSSEFLRQDSQSSYSFGNTANVEEIEEKIWRKDLKKKFSIYWRKVSYFVFIYIFPLVLQLYFLFPRFRFSLIVEQILAFASKPNMFREVKNLSPNLKKIAWQSFALLNILIWIVTSILSLNSNYFHKKL